jgi:branched-chain amino acid transport system substrate-binding protein
MKWSLLIAAILLTFHFSAFGASSAPDSSDLQSQLELAKRLYQSTDYRASAQLIEELAGGNASYEKLPDLRVMEAKSWYHAGERDRAADLLDELVAGSSNRGLRATCRYFLGRIAYDDGNYGESASHFISASDLTTDPELRSLCYSNCLNLCIGYLTPSEQESLFRESHSISDSLAADLTYDTAERYHEAGLHKRAKRIIDTHSAPVDKDDRRFRGLEDRIDLELSRLIEIALLLPLSGDLSAYGRQMNAAAELAVSTCSTTAANIRMRSYDTFGNSIVASQLSRDVTSSGVSAVIGPLTSQEAVGAAPYSEFWSVPMILPAASEKGLTSVSSRVFQLSPTPETMGIRLAEAAIEELGLDSVAILAPNDGYGRQITEGFRKVAAENDVEIFYEVYFPRGSSDYRRFMLNLKEAVLPDSFDSTIFLDETGDTLEIEEIAVNVPAMLIPAFADELQFIIPQLRFYRIGTVILGSEDLGAPEVVSLDPLRHYSAMFVSHSTFTESDTSWLRFRYLLEQESGLTTTPVAGLTFDAVRMTIDAGALGGFSSDGIARGWQKLGRVSGVTGPFEFNEQNENIAVPVFILMDGMIEKWPY